MYLSKIVQGSNTLYIKDAEAREAISELQAYTDYLGVTTTALENGSNVNPIMIAGESVTAKKGNIVNFGAKEFIFNGSIWQEFGDLSALGELAYVDSATGSVTAAGTNAPSAVSFAAHTTADFVTGVDTAAVAPSFTEGAFSAGTLPSFTEGAFSAGTLPSLGAATTSAFATEGVTATYTENNETLTLGVAATSNAVTAQGSFNAGTLPSKTADTWSAGTLPSKAADSFSAGSAATFNTAKAITALGAATAAAQTFTGSAVDVTVSAAA